MPAPLLTQRKPTTKTGASRHIPIVRSRRSHLGKTAEARANQIANLKGAKSRQNAAQNAGLDLESVETQAPPKNKKLKPKLRDYEFRPKLFRHEFRYLDNGKLYGDCCDVWQEEIQDALDERDSHGFPRHRFAYVQLARGHDKTGCNAMRALHDLIFGPHGCLIPIYAADREQAAIMVRSLRDIIHRHPILNQCADVSRMHVRNKDTDGMILVQSSDAASAYGEKPYRVYVEELHAWIGPKAQELFEVILSSTGKIPGCQLIVTTNAGANFASVCRKVYTMAQEDPAWYFYEGDGPIASWLSDDWYRQMKRMLTPGAYDRLILNQWVPDTNQFAVPQAVDACCSLSHQPERIEGCPIAIGVDLGLTRDLAVIAVVESDIGGEEYRVLEMLVWKGTATNPVQIETIELHVTTLREKYPEAIVLADPWQMQNSIQRLQLQEFNFTGTHLVQLTAVLWRLVNESRLHWWPQAGALTHRGRSSDLTSEVKELVLKHMSYGDRLDHPPAGTSDRSIAMGMACWWLSQMALNMDIDFFALPMTETEAGFEIERMKSAEMAEWPGMA